MLWLFRRDLSVRARWTLIVANGLVLAVLTAGAVLTPSFERAARQAVYGPGVRVALRTGEQEIVLVGGGKSGRPLALFVNGRLRVSGREEVRYHEALIHPAMAAGPHGRVLVLGGGDGLAAREVLRYPGVRSVTVVERDAEVVRLARRDPGLSALNGGAYRDPRVRVVTADAFDWLRRSMAYDVVVCDLPAPELTPSTKYYSQEFYGLAERALAPGGRLVVHAGPLRPEPRAFWTVDATIRSVGLRTAPYVIDTPHPGRGSPRPGRGSPHDWGFVLAARSPVGVRLAPHDPRPRSLTEEGLRAARRAAGRHREAGLPPSTLMRPRYGE